MYKKLWLSSIVIFVVAGLLMPLPDPEVHYSSILYGNDGKILSAITSNEQQWIFPLDEKIPGPLKECIIMYEDEYFTYHPGINPISMVKAVTDYYLGGKKLRGASTIPMQVMRMKRKNPKRTLFNKAIESIYAIKYKLITTDETIIHDWCSIAPFGGNTIGIKAASHRYFGRSLDKLSWSEYALLAVMPNSPTKTTLSKNRNNLKSKRDFLLKKLHKKGFFNSDELVLYLGEEIPSETNAIPQYAYHLLRYLTKKHPNQYIFRTTINTDIQLKTYELLLHESEFLKLDDIKNLAITIVDIQNNHLLAYHGNSPPETDKFSYVDIVQAPRSYGSLLKPLLYAHALDIAQVLPNEMIADVPTIFGDFQPENFDKKFRGAIHLEEMIIQSLNVPAVRLLHNLGLSSFYDMIKKMDLQFLNKGAEHYGLSIILGGGETSLWELSRIYKGLSQNYYGVSDPYKDIQIITEHKGNRTRSSFSFSPFAIDHTVKAMADLTRPREEKSWQLYGQNYKVAWKTGTSYGHKDAWAMGFNGAYMVGVWVGNEGGEGRTNLTGISRAAPIMFKIFNSMSENRWFGNAPKYSENEIISVCLESGKIAGPLCKNKSKLKIEKTSFKYQPCHYHQEVLLNNRLLRLNSSCYQNVAFRDTFFVLPSYMEYYFKQANTHYQILPPYDPSCLLSESSCKIIYPQNGIKIFLPKENTTKQNSLITKAYHRHGDAMLYWFVDDQYITTTKSPQHDCVINIGVGHHVLNITDQWGNKDEVNFEIIK